MADLLTNLAFGLAAFTTLFTIVNPIGNIPFFVMLTESYSQDLRRRVAARTVQVALVVLILFALAGNVMFLVFHVTVHALRIAGGLLLFSIAYAMLHGERSRTQLTSRDRQEVLEKEAVGVVPLGIPMFAGPGAITAVVVLMGEAAVPTLDLVLAFLVIVAILATLGISYVLLRNAHRIADRFGRLGLMAVSRVLGIFLAAIAVQLIIVGVQGAWLTYFG
ncbi:MAG: NAAT family transporter [Thermoplasmata archaeon]|nr:NAAT family transporter [Thermoplasmata archaeon]